MVLPAIKVLVTSPNISATPSPLMTSTISVGKPDRPCCHIVAHEVYSPLPNVNTSGITADRTIIKLNLYKPLICKKIHCIVSGNHSKARYRPTRNIGVFTRLNRVPITLDNHRNQHRTGKPPENALCKRSPIKCWHQSSLPPPNPVAHLNRNHIQAKGNRRP